MTHRDCRGTVLETATGFAERYVDPKHDVEATMSKVSYLLELTIGDGNLEAFKDMANGFAKTVQESEPDTLTYRWRIGEDGKRCLVHEGFASSAALMTHLGNIGASLPRLFAIAPITRVEVFGPASDQVRAALADFGPHYFPDFAGFER